MTEEQWFKKLWLVHPISSRNGSDSTAFDEAKFTITNKEYKNPATEETQPITWEFLIERYGIYVANIKDKNSNNPEKRFHSQIIPLEDWLEKDKFNDELLAIKEEDTERKYLLGYKNRSKPPEL